MAKRSKELFELLKPGQASARRSADPAPQTERRGPKSTPGEPGARPGFGSSLIERALNSVKSVSGGVSTERGGIGGRKVNVSLNILLMFIGAFVVTNVCSYMVGRRAGPRHEVPLVTEIRQFQAVQVTPPFPADFAFEAWQLSDLLIEAGLDGVEVLGRDNGARLQVIAGKFDRTEKKPCRERAELVQRTVDRLGAAGKVVKNIPIDVGIITISYKHREPYRAP
jgi:hypothetical protein